MRGCRRVCAVFAIVVGSTAPIPAVASAAAAPPVGVVFGGETSQREVITVEVNPARTKVVRLRFSWTADCTPGPAATLTTGASTGWTEYRGPFPMDATGAWKKSLVVNTLEGQLQQQFSYSFAGRRAGGRMTGTLNAALTETGGSGQLVRTCTALPIKFAISEAHVFGGLTVGARDPLFVLMNSAGTKVLRLRWDWHGRCTAGAAARSDTQLDITWRDLLTNFPVDRLGRFGGTGTFGPEAIPGQGFSRTFTYKVVARHTGQTIRGSIAPSFVETDTASGGVIRECKSARLVKFRVKD